MILHFSQIGFTELLTFTVILLSTDQQSCYNILPETFRKCKHFFCLCSGLKMSTLNAKIFLIFSLLAIRTINSIVYCAIFTQCKFRLWCDTDPDPDHFLRCLKMGARNKGYSHSKRLFYAAIFSSSLLYNSSAVLYSCRRRG